MKVVDDVKQTKIDSLIFLGRRNGIVYTRRLNESYSHLFYYFDKVALQFGR